MIRAWSAPITPAPITATLIVTISPQHELPAHRWKAPQHRALERHEGPAARESCRSAALRRIDDRQQHTHVRQTLSTVDKRSRAIEDAVREVSDHAAEVVGFRNVDPFDRSASLQQDC